MFLRCVGSFLWFSWFFFLRCCFGWWLCCKPHNQHIQRHPASGHHGAGTRPRSRRSSHSGVLTSTQHSSQEARHWGVGVLENREEKPKHAPKDAPFPHSYSARFSNLFTKNNWWCFLFLILDPLMTVFSLYHGVFQNYHGISRFFFHANLGVNHIF